MEIKRKNVEIREKAKECGVFLWEIAKELGYSENWFSKNISRKEFSEGNKEECLRVIEDIAFVKSERKKFFDSIGAIFSAIYNVPYFNRCEFSNEWGMVFKDYKEEQISRAVLAVLRGFKRFPTIEEFKHILDNDLVYESAKEDVSDMQDIINRFSSSN